MKVLIIGGSAGGASVAARLRRLNESAQIILFEKGHVVSFATCGIPYYLGGVIKDRDRLNVFNPDEFNSILNVELRVLSEVTSINRERQSITVKDYKTDCVYEESYDKLVLAPGGRAIYPSIDGIDAPHIFTIRDAYDTDSVQEYIVSHDCKNALIIGGGYIGLEMADNLHNIGMDITIVDTADQVMGSLDYEMATALHQHLAQKKVRLLLKDEVVSINKFSVSLKSRKNLFADIIILALGIKPDVRLASKAGLRIGAHGGILVNKGLVTSDEHIYALGDAVEVKDSLTQGQALVPLAGLAHKQARVVAENICGMHHSIKNTQTTAIAKIFDLCAAVTGTSEKALIARGINYKKSYIEAPSRAGFYPGAYLMSIKLLFAANTGRLFGAQVVGSDGVDKRIDVLATAISMGLTVSELTDLELAYAPPYSTAKDPVNIAGMVAHNMLYDNYRVVHWDELDMFLPKYSRLVDVRTAEEFELGSLDNAINIPLTELRDRIDELPNDKRIIVFCQYGKKGYFAYRMLAQLGFKNVFNLSGGMNIFRLGTNVVEDSAPIRMPAEIHAANNSQVDIPSAPIELLEKEHKKRESAHHRVIEVDACGLSCPGPIMKLSKVMLSAEVGDIIRITATDGGFSTDVKTWCNRKGHKLVKFDDSQRSITVELEKCASLEHV